jgi:bifunctional UDP-N-acetylglucosamine pyrophosphorylase/glucosamine-1-phosphate N-acetyltransferase
MLPVAGKPILEHLMLELFKAGIRDFVLVVGYQEFAVRDYFKSGEKWGFSVEYRLQARPTGTAAAVKMVQDAVDGPFLVVNGDSIMGHADIAGLVAAGGNRLGVRKVEQPEQFGVVELDRERVVRIHEKSVTPPSNLANAGLYLFAPDIFAAVDATPVSPRGEYELPAAIEILISRGHEVNCSYVDSWLEMSYPWDLLMVGEKLMEGLNSRNEGVIEENVHVNGALQVGRGSRLRSGTYVDGPVIIGENCDIGPNCFLRGSTAIGSGCHIGAGVEVKNSLVMDGAKLPHLSYVGDSVIGENCNLGAGTKIANLRLDKKNVVAGGIQTNRRKLGTIMGDGVQTGINCCINTGTVIGAGAWIGPGAVARGNIANGARVF